MPPVTQLWSEFSKIVKTTNDVMLPFLKMFGVEEGNGISPFARNFENPSDLIAAINTFFMPPASDPRDGTDINIEEDPQESDDDKEEASPPDGTSTVLTAFLEERLEELIELDDEKEEQTKSNENNGSQCDLAESARVDSFESFFDDGDGGAALTMLRHMLSQTSITDVSLYAYKLTQVREFEWHSDDHEVVC